jgi:hypothetical protein
MRSEGSQLLCNGDPEAQIDSKRRGGRANAKAASNAQHLRRCDHSFYDHRFYCTCSLAFGAERVKGLPICVARLRRFYHHPPKQRQKFVTRISSRACASSPSRVWRSRTCSRCTGCGPNWSRAVLPCAISCAVYCASAASKSRPATPERRGAVVGEIDPARLLEALADGGGIVAPSLGGATS